MLDGKTQHTDYVGAGEKAINGSGLILRGSVLLAEKGHSHLTLALAKHLPSASHVNDLIDCSEQPRNLWPLFPDFTRGASEAQRA